MAKKNYFDPGMFEEIKEYTDRLGQRSPDKTSE